MPDAQPLIGRTISHYRIVELTDEIVRLQEENRGLKAQLGTKQAMSPRGDHNYFYKGDEGPYCLTCWQKSKAEVLLPAPIKDTLGTPRSSRVCMEHYYETKKQQATQIRPRTGPWS